MAERHKHIRSFSSSSRCYRFLYLLLIGWIAGPLSAAAQDSLQPIQRIDSLAKLRVNSIELIGNNKTKSYIILREMRVKTGDSIPAAHLYETLQQSRDLVYNTSLFSEVNVYPVLVSGKEINIFVVVRERWYIYPTPQFKPVDRNINEWIKTYNADLKRVTYGIKFAHYNFSGRNDQLRIYLLNGYSRTVLLNYAAPYSNPSLTEGFGVSAGYSSSREVLYKTSYNNKLQAFQRDNFVREDWYLRGDYQLRRGYFRRHIFSAGYYRSSVDDSVVTSKYNPAYYNNGKSSTGYMAFGYSFVYTKVDNVNYPLRGKQYSLSLWKKGFGFNKGIDNLLAEARYNAFRSFGKNWYGSLQLQTDVSFPFESAYINQRLMGYGEFYLRGLEYYVIDGYHASMAKFTLKKKIWGFTIPIPWKIKAIPSVPFQFFAKTYADAGYAIIQSKREAWLNNRPLYTSGIGIDVLTLYDLNLKFEYSINQFGEKGLFLHAKSSF